ncbi:hypothetical protein ONZ45_g7125 [Pleurotus djamor]|nr:hypothetical protein ONZ45_g7125 [Pleurotus djamor]
MNNLVLPNSNPSCATFDSSLTLQPSVSRTFDKTNLSISHLGPVPSTAPLEKGFQAHTPWDGYAEDDLPEKSQEKLVRNIRHQVFSLYRRFFGLAFAANIAILIAVLVKGEVNSLKLAQIVIANLFCAVLMRQEYVVNAFFTVSLATLVVTYIVLSVIIAIMFFAYPAIRTSKHDTFERTHRFLGWTCTAIVVLLTNGFKPPNQTLGSSLVKAPSFWLLLIMTCSIILPWLRLRKVPVRAEVLSPHAIRIYFDHITPEIGTSTRLSDSPLLEWHSFANIPIEGVKGYSLVVSRAGDWTSKHIDHPPTKLWVRGIPAYGVLRIIPIFRRIVLVATGSGIGPCMASVLERRIPIKLLWTSPDVRGTFGDELVDSILTASPDAVIYDTRKYGKPDMVKLTLTRKLCALSPTRNSQAKLYTA